MLAELAARLRGLRDRIMLMVGRGVVVQSRHEGGRQRLQLKLLAGELRDNVECFQQMGFASRPRKGDEVVVVCIGGQREAALAIATESRNHTPSDLAPGESCLYNASGTRIYLRQGGAVEVVNASGVTIDAPVEINGDLTVNGDSDLGGNVDVDGNMTAMGEVLDRAVANTQTMELMRFTYNGHLHLPPDFTPVPKML